MKHTHPAIPDPPPGPTDFGGADAASDAGGANPVLQRLKAEIRQIEHGRRGALRAVLPFDIASLDAHLPDGGLVQGALHEVMGGGADLVHGAAAALFIAGIVARLGGTVLWCLTRRDLFAPGLAAAGLDPGRVIHAEAGNDAAVLLAMEEGLRHPGLAAVVGEVRRLPMTASRRLQLAAETSGVTAFALHRWPRLPPGGVVPVEPSAGVTRWQVAAAPGPGGDLRRALWRVSLQRCRAASPSEWLLEACDAQGRLAVPAQLADRPVAAERDLRRVA
ncbi:MAG: ImuA family protein [Janthinobacterium lividum]